jgi:hypothetical protein
MHVHPSSMDPKMTDRKKVKKLSKKINLRKQEIVKFLKEKSKKLSSPSAITFWDFHQLSN